MGGAMSEARPPFPPFTHETAIQKVQAAEDAWNSRDPQRVAAAYTVDSIWRNRDVFVNGRE
jgi:nuclear transport factor 2 (NTF2) superfamily protein